MTHGTPDVVGPATAYSRCLEEEKRGEEALEVVEEGLGVGSNGSSREGRYHVLMLMTKASVMEGKGRGNEAVAALERAYAIMKRADMDKDPAFDDHLRLDLLHRVKDVYGVMGMVEEEEAIKAEIVVVEERVDQSLEEHIGRVRFDHEDYRVEVVGRKTRGHEEEEQHEVGFVID